MLSQHLVPVLLVMAIITGCKGSMQFYTLSPQFISQFPCRLLPEALPARYR